MDYKNNMSMTNDEMADIAESIITGEPLNEQLGHNLAEFIKNYKNMSSILTGLQEVLLKRAKNSKKDPEKYNEGDYMQALRMSRKVESQLAVMNKEASKFIKYTRKALDI